MGTFGPDYEEELDGERLRLQHETIRDFMLALGRLGVWVSLDEIEQKLGYPQASISAQLRHLRKEKFGAYVVEKRRRRITGGTWEYRVLSPIRCFRCHKKPHELEEYRELANAMSLRPSEAVIAEEGTYNPATRTFACTMCYCAIGAPSTPRGWVAPAAGIDPMDWVHLGRAIKNDVEYGVALNWLERLIEEDPARGTPEGEKLEKLATLIETYEREHFPMTVKGVDG